jgi:hypothetical protein
MPVILNNTGITFNDGTSIDTNIFPAGTSMLFEQNSAPTGWTKQTTHNDKALRVVSGTAGSGGSAAFSSVMASRGLSGTVSGTTLSLAQIPSHQHDLGNNQTWQGFGTDDFNFSFPGAGDANTVGLRDFGESYIGSKGGSASHSHSFTGTAVDMRVAYVDIIIANKD